MIITGSVCKALMPVFRLLRGDFKIFNPTAARRYTNGAEIWRELQLLHVKFYPSSAGAPKTENIVQFEDMDVYLGDFYHIFRVCGELHV